MIEVEGVRITTWFPCGCQAREEYVDGAWLVMWTQSLGAVCEHWKLSAAELSTLRQRDRLHGQQLTLFAEQTAANAGT